MQRRSLALRLGGCTHFHHTSAYALEAANTDQTDNPEFEVQVLSPAAQQPTLRLTFLDGEGNLQSATLASTQPLYIGSTRAELRRRALWRTFEKAYSELGCKLQSLEVIQTTPYAL